MLICLMYDAFVDLAEYFDLKIYMRSNQAQHQIEIKTFSDCK